MKTLASVAFLGVLVIAGCSLPEAAPVIALKGVSLDRTSSMLFTGETEQLSATFDPTNATKKDVAWSTDNPGVAAVSSSGLVTAVAAGTATIVVTTVDGARTATHSVLVMSVAGVDSAAARLAATRNSDGGWEWQNPDTDPSTGMPSPANTLGVTAQGLLDAYKVTGTGAYLAAAEATYEALLANSTSVTPGTHKIRGPDISFLVGLSAATGDPKFASFAKARYQATVLEFGSGTATGLARYVRGVRHSQPPLIAWDIATYVRAAVALDGYFPGEGFGHDAAAMAEVIYAALYQPPEDFSIADQAQDSYWLSITGAVESFTLTGLHGAERDSLKISLLASQQADGHFIGVLSGGQVQTTAYAVIALVKAGEKDSAMKAIAYLAGAQGTNGGWTESDGSEYTEVDSEALDAIYECMRGF